MALGIFAFAIIPVIGLLSTGLSASRESVNVTTISQILRAADALLSTNLSVTSTNLHFTQEGERVPAGDSMAVFQARVSQVTPTDAARGLLSRKIWQVQIVNPSATNVVYSTRTIQFSRELETNDFR